MPLKPFQIEDLARAALQDGAIIAWEPGMGKSLAAIAWPLVKKARRTLVVAPGSLHYQMMASAAKFFKISLRQVKDKEDFFRLKLDSPPPANGPPRFYLTSYQALGLNEADEWSETFGHKGQPRPNKLLVKRRKAWCKLHRVRYDANAGDSIGSTHNGITCVWEPTMARIAQTHGSFDCVVVDEGTRLQATESRIGASVRTLEPRYRLVLTGTPIKNRLESIFWLCAWAAGHTGRWPYESTDAAKERFADTFLQKERFLTKEEEAAKKSASRSITKRSARICSIHRLWKTLAPVIIRRRKADCGEEIAQKTVTPILVKPGTAQLAVYQYHLQNAPLAGKKPGAKIAHRRTQVGMQITNLRLAALCPNAENLSLAKTGVKGAKRSWTEWTPKLFTTLQIIRECLASGKQVIVGSPFRDFSQTLQAKLIESEVASVLLDGDTSPEQRGLLADEFKQGKQAVLIAGLKAMGEGHSFENCAHLILPGLSYAYDENEQFIHRIWRLTSPGPVNIYPIVMEGSIDQNLHEIFTEKGDASNLAIDGRLFTEPTADIDMEWLIKEAMRIFKADVKTEDEEILMAQWEVTLARQLRHAYLQYLEHTAVDDPPTPEDVEQALSALSIPSPTQLTIDICRKHNKKGIKITDAQIKDSVERIKRNKK
jgi:superfamily II DNA or RNA helicase